MDLQIGQLTSTTICTINLFLRMTKVFLDTSFAIALSARNDQHHPKAVQLAEQIEADGTHLITTQAILLEIGNALSKQRYRTAAVQLLSAIAADSTIEVIPLSETLYLQAFNLFSSRADKEWGLIDCVSFIVMQERNLRSALTADEHFQQAGFQALLRN